MEFQLPFIMFMFPVTKVEWSGIVRIFSKCFTVTFCHLLWMDMYDYVVIMFPPPWQEAHLYEGSIIKVKNIHWPEANRHHFFYIVLSYAFNIQLPYSTCILKTCSKAERCLHCLKSFCDRWQCRCKWWILINL